MLLSQWIDYLRDHRNCSTVFQEFLEYIQEKMLVDKEKRETSAMVRKRLGEMFQKCKQDTNYALNGDQTKVSTWRETSSMCCC